MPLIVGDIKVQKISGPVSCVVLKPTDQFLVLCADSGITAPMYMLFGDYHRSTRGMCHRCNCDNTSRDCCYPVYSEEFLGEFDNITRDHGFPISVFNEGVDYIDYKDNVMSKYYPIDQFSFKNMSCYNKELKYDDNENPCPYKYLQWHAGDARFFKSKKYYYESVIDMYIDNLSKLYDRFLKKEMTVQNIIKMRNYLEDRLKNSIQDYKKVLIDIIKSTDKMYEKEFYSNIFEKFQHCSVIYKQYSKLSNNIIKEKVKLAINENYEYLNNKFNTIGKYVNLKLINDIFEEYISDNIDATETLNKINDVFYFIENAEISSNDFKSLIILYNSQFLDLYTILRSLKFTSTETPNMCIGYFGDAHRKQTTHFLVNLMKFYTVEHFINAQEKHMRCLSFDNININILDMLYEQKFKYFKYVLTRNSLAGPWIDISVIKFNSATKTQLFSEDLLTRLCGNPTAEEKIELVKKLQTPLEYDIINYRTIVANSDINLTLAKEYKNSSLCCMYARYIELTPKNIQFILEQVYSANQQAELYDILVVQRNIHDVIILPTVLAHCLDHTVLLIFEHLLNKCKCIITTDLALIINSIEDSKNIYTKYIQKYTKSTVQELLNMYNFDLATKKLNELNYEMLMDVFELKPVDTESNIVNYEVNKEYTKLFDIVLRKLQA